MLIFLVSLFHVIVYNPNIRVIQILGGGCVWKRGFVFFILLVSCLGIVFNSTSVVKADANTSTYDVTIISGESSDTNQSSANNQKDEVLLPKTGTNNRTKGWLPQLSEQQTLSLIIGGLLLIIVLLYALVRQLKKREQAS
jgi:hypothetical protein